MYKVLNFIALKYYFDFFLEKRQICFVTTKDAAIFAPALIKSNDSVAQLVEHNTFNVGVLGSSPSGITEASANAGASSFSSGARSLP